MNQTRRISQSAAEDSRSRAGIIVRTSIIGILANVFLAAFKAAIGWFSGSIAITMDAVNNLSDATSSVITIVGTKLAGRSPDRKHPYGHGRAEYLTAMLISVIVLYAGLTSLIESIKKIIHPETPDYSVAALIIIAVAVVVKILLGRYVKGVGEKVNSDSLINSGEDAKLDSVISAATLLAAILYLTLHFSVEAWLAAVISLVIIKSGIEMLRDTLSQILGERADGDLAREIKATVCSFPGVQGAYDLVLNNYGPDSFNGSVHIEVPDTFSVSELDELLRTITLEVYRKHHVILTAIGVYSMNTKDDDAMRMRAEVAELLTHYPNILQMHGFFLNKEKHTIRFDMVVSFDETDRPALYKAICEEVQQKYPDYTLQITMDSDITDL